MRRGLIPTILLISFSLLHEVTIAQLKRPAAHSLARSLSIEKYQDNFKIDITHISESVTIDGELNEAIWKQADKAGDFFMKYPNDKEDPIRQTEAQVAYDDKFMYVAFTCYDTSNLIIQSLKRDIGHIDNDGVGIILDPMNLHTTGFIFMVNAFNAQSDEQLSLSQDNEIQWSWNSKWFSATKRYKDHWTAEMAIPFKTLRYPPDHKKWGVNFIRVDMKKNQYSVWTHVPVNFRIYNLGYTGALLWDSLPPQAKSNMVVIPYVTGSAQEDRENGEKLNVRGNAGVDAKLALNSSLNLDLTVNPDFSQVEVDQQVTNLTRFDLFFPERRNFFLENSDIFGEYGIPGLMTPFYSRRIGLDNEGNRIPILGGVRLTGSVTPTTRIGVMDIQTGGKGDFAAQNYSAVSINQNVFGRSVIKGYYLDRESFMTDAAKQADPLAAWGRNAGATFDYISRSGKWNSWLAYHTSFKPGVHGSNNYIETGFGYTGSRFSNMLDLVTLGTNYYTDMGFVQRIVNYDAERDTSIRLGFSHIYDNATMKWFPRKGPVSRHTLSLENYIVFNPNGSLNEHEHTLKYKLEMKNTVMLDISVMNDGVNLLFPISFTGETPLPAAHYAYSNLTVDFFSDSRKSFSYTLGGTYGGFYNGTIRSLKGGVIIRSRPHVNIGILGEYDQLAFPDPYGSTSLFLLSPKVEINFSTTLSWTTFLQYNTQRNNFNINSRFQYRFKPMSDIYLVYTDNYFTDPFMRNKNRSLVFKMNYWLNL
jgi:hypothetical protein